MKYIKGSISAEDARKAADEVKKPTIYNSISAEMNRGNYELLWYNRSPSISMDSELAKALIEQGYKLYGDESSYNLVIRISWR